jgi:HEPN domain-containing protein
MKKESENWIGYAKENLSSAEILLNNSLFNPCLQNIQQTIEKVLKALLIENSVEFKKTHSINELIILLNKNDKNIDLSEEEIELIDSIYLPSKYPLGSALPDFYPDEKICEINAKHNYISIEFGSLELFGGAKYGNL